MFPDRGFRSNCAWIRAYPRAFSWTLVASMLAAFAVSSTTMAADAPVAAAAAMEFRAMDTDGNRCVSRAEYAAAAQKMFDLMDANRDGQVTAAELAAAQEKISGGASDATRIAAEKMRVLDANGDGLVSRAEYAAAARQKFERMDTNKDGVLTLGELTAGHALSLRAARK